MIRYEMFLAEVFQTTNVCDAKNVSVDQLACKQDRRDNIKHFLELL